MNPITLTFTPEQMQVLNAALLEVPYKLAAPLISSINSQIQRQFDARKDEQGGSSNNLPTTDAAPNNY